MEQWVLTRIKRICPRVFATIHENHKTYADPRNRGLNEIDSTALERNYFVS